MANSSLLQVRVDPDDREKASEILESLGTNLSGVVNMLLKQIIITEGIPFEIRKITTPKKNKKTEGTDTPADQIIVIPAKPRRIIPAMEYTGMISLIPKGEVARYEDINRYFEEKYHVESVEPDYSGWPAYDNDGNQIPYWRVIGSRGAVTGANRCNARQQYEYLSEEGIELVPYKKSYRVVDYKKYLHTFVSDKAKR